MIKAVYLLASLGTMVISIWLFYYAAGSLSIKKLNVVSFTFYNLLVFTCVGGFAILMGFRDHYLGKKIQDEAVVIKTSLMIGYVLISLPLAIILYEKLFSILSPRRSFQEYCKAKVQYAETEKNILILVTAGIIICSLGTIYLFYQIGSIPVIEVYLRGADGDLMRQAASRNFQGNTYIKNILVLGITPMLSYMSYVYMRVSRHRKKVWVAVFAYSFLLTCLIKTYDLEKAPIIYFIFYLYMIEIILGNRKITRILYLVGGVGICLVALMYIMAGYEGTFFTISSGPGGRIFMTQVATLFLHVKAFPKMHPYLAGASLPTVLAKLFGSSDSWIRSGRIVMETFNKEAVEQGIAGVMNALFIGEAYANWGIPGTLIAPWIVAATISIAFALQLKMRKTPVNIVINIALVSSLTGALQGGFIDYLYNISLIVIIVLFWGISIIARRGTIRIYHQVPIKEERE